MTVPGTGMAAPSVRPILVTGSHRSGTTWVGRMLGLARGVGYVHEPFSIHHRPGICRARFAHWFPYITAENEATYLESVRRTLAFRFNTAADLASVRRPIDVKHFLKDLCDFTRYRWTGARPLLKDPLALFSAEWLATRFDMVVVVLIRHPAAFVSSIKKIQWRHPFGDFLAQPLLMRDWLQPFADEIRRHAERQQDLIEEAALLWNVIHYTIARCRERHPEWIFVRHEDLSRDPLAGYARLFAETGLTFDDAVQRAVREHSEAGNETDPADFYSIRRDSRKNIANWKQRLSAEEIERVRRAVADVAREFYAEDEW